MLTHSLSLAAIRPRSSSGIRSSPDPLTVMTSSAAEGKQVAAAEHPIPPWPRPRPALHNFSFPTISWGAQRLLRCDSSVVQEPTGQHPPPPPPPPRKEPAEEEEASSSAAAAAAARPWNLRSRRAACSAPPPPESNGRQPNGSSRSPLQPERNGAALKSARLRSEGGKEKVERRPFSLPLSKYEIEEDFLLLKGTKPSRRPKKRPRIVQRQLDSLFPGLWLQEVTPDTYKVSE